MTKKIYKNVKVNDIRNFSNGHTECMFIVSPHTQSNHYEQINSPYKININILKMNCQVLSCNLYFGTCAVTSFC